MRLVQLESVWEILHLNNVNQGTVSKNIKSESNLNEKDKLEHESIN